MKVHLEVGHTTLDVVITACGLRVRADGNNVAWSSNQVTCSRCLSTDVWERQHTQEQLQRQNELQHSSRRGVKKRRGAKAKDPLGRTISATSPESWPLEGNRLVPGKHRELRVAHERRDSRRPPATSSLQRTQHLPNSEKVPPHEGNPTHQESGRLGGVWNRRLSALLQVSVGVAIAWLVLKCSSL